VIDTIETITVVETIIATNTTEVNVVDFMEIEIIVAVIFVTKEEIIIIIQTTVILKVLVMTIEIGKIIDHIATCVNVETTDIPATDITEVMIGV